MRNYPNMSYCMFENTQGAMNQLAEFMIEADQDDVLDISRTELRAMQELVGYCEQYIRLVACGLLRTVYSLGRRV